MSLVLRNLGWWKPDNEYASRNNRVVLPTSIGTTIVVVADSNAPEAYAQNNTYGDGTDGDCLRIYEVNSAFTAAVEVAVIASNGLGDFDCISADLFEDNSVGIAYMTANQGLKYRKVTYGSWTVGASESVRSSAQVSGTVQQVDISISKSDCVSIAHIMTNSSNPKVKLQVTTRETSGGTWVLNDDTNLMTTSDPNITMLSLSVQYGRAGSPAARPLSILVANAQQDGADAGFRLYSAIVGESGGMVTNMTLRKTYLGGDMSTGWGQMVRRGYLFNSSDSAEITVAIMQAVDKRNLLVSRFTWDSTTWSETIPPQTSTVGLDKIKINNRFSASYANDRVNFYYGAEFNGAPPTPINYVCTIRRTDNSVTFSGFYRWDNMENVGQDRVYSMAGTGKFAYHANARHAMCMFDISTSGLFRIRVHDVKAAPAPTNLSPVDGMSAPSAMPNLSFRASLGKKWPQSRHKAVWELATDSAFTSDLRHFEQDDSKLVKIENTDDSSAYVYFADTLPTDLALTSGTWYVRGALIDEFGKTGNWTPTNSFTLLHPPTAINLYPNSGSVLNSGNIVFTWDFTDPSPTDTQSAFQVIVEDNNTGAVLHDSGQQMFSYESYLLALDNSYQGILLRWKIRLWDADGSPGEYSDYQTFTVAAGPSVVIDSPTEGSTVMSGSPRILFTPTTSAGRKVVRYQVTLTQNGSVVRDSNVQAVDSDSGVQLSWRVTGEILPDMSQYGVTVMVADETGLSSTDSIDNFTVDYDAPPSPSGVAALTTDYNTDGLGYVTVVWADTNRDPNFSAWVVYRRSDLIGSDGISIVELGEWTEITRVVSTASSYNFLDYYAPSGYKVSYKIRQLVDRTGDLALSGDSQVVSVYPKAEGYWIIVPTDEDGIISTAFRLHNVTDDSYTDEYEENTFTIIGRGRHIDSGDYLGVNGSLTAKLRNTGSTTARQKKRQLESARAEKTSLFMRNPFGDVYRIRVGNLSISRLAGVGVDEFVDVTIPYSEVAE
jgi:hypothetical protein